MCDDYILHNYTIIEVQIEKKTGKQTLRVYGDVSASRSELFATVSELNSKYWGFSNSRYTKYSKTWHVVDLGVR